MNINFFKKLFLFLFLLSCQQAKKEPTKNAPVDESIDNRKQSLKLIADSLYKRDDYAKAIKYFDTLIELDPHNGELYYKRGYSYDMVYKRPELKEAIADYLKSIELGYEKADCYYNLGLSYMFQNDSTAISYFKKSLEVKPDNPDVVILIGQCKKRLNDKKHQRASNTL